jgi:hypothetical protein
MHVPRLEQILGYPLNELNWDRVCQLADREVPEDQSLDFKGHLYAPAEALAKRTADDWAEAKLAKAIEVAKDVAAFANANGGMILLGVPEDDQARAKKPTGVPMTDDERLKITTMVASRVHPWVQFSIQSLPDPHDPTRGVIAIIVPPSDAAPHLVNYGTGKDPAFRIPIRVDRATQYLGEHQLAARYRDRFTNDRAAVNRISTISDEGLQRLMTTEDHGWLSLTATPTRIGDHRKTVQASQDWLQSVRAAHPELEFPEFNASRVGRGRIVHTSDHNYTGASARSHAELHHNGSGFVASATITVPLPQQSFSFPPVPPTGNLVLGAGDLQVWTLGALLLLASHAVDSGAGGDLLIQAQLVPARRSAAGLESLPIEPGNIPIELWNSRYPEGWRRVANSLTVSEPEPYQITTSLGVANAPADLVAAAADISREIIEEFAVASPLMLREDGTVHLTGFGARDVPREIKLLSTWAERHGLITDANDRQ